MFPRAAFRDMVKSPDWRRMESRTTTTRRSRRCCWAAGSGVRDGDRRVREAPEGTHFPHEQVGRAGGGGVMGADEAAKLQKEIRSLKKQVERLEASRSTFELMVDRNDKLLSRQLEQTQRQAEELNRINLL